MGRSTSILVLGVGAFGQSTAQIMKEAGAETATYLTRNYGHYPPSLAGPIFDKADYPSPVPLVRKLKANLVVPMSIDWAQAEWAAEFLASRVPIFCPTGEGMRIERERDFARKLCHQYKVPFPKSYVAPNRLAAEKILKKHPRPYVIKNPLCSPTSPIHTILCETVEDTRSWLRSINYAEGVFLQEYLGRAEVGHIAVVSGGEVYSLATNQEYKRAFAGDMGVVAGAPLGGLVEKDPDDKYGLARTLLQPLRPWFRAVQYNGPIQVTAVQRSGKWHVIEYNIRIGVTSGAMILRLLENPMELLLRTARNQRIEPRFKPEWNFGCSVTLAGYGYPYVQVRAPALPIEVGEPFDAGCDVWWNEVTRETDGRLMSSGHRIGDVIAFGPTLEKAIQGAYRNIRRIRSLGSYYRPDIGRSLWPPGSE